MLLGMYVVWWVVGEGRPGACGVSIAIITQQASNQEKRKKERQKEKKTHKHW
jgi:hypothetical protein